MSYEWHLYGGEEVDVDDESAEEGYASWNLIAQRCLERQAWLNSWELGFVKNLAVRDDWPTDKQARRLELIFNDLKIRELNHARR
jgi:hypothetical protein